MGGFEEDFLQEVADADVGGDVRLLRGMREYDEILEKRYSWSLGRLAWWDMPKGPWRKEDADPESREDSVRSFLDPIQRHLHIDPDSQIVFIGDMVMDTVLIMTWRTLLAYCGVLFSWPQHHYVMPPDGAWCFTYTFEDDMCFCFAAD